MERELLGHEEAIQLERLERSRGEHDCEDAELKHEQRRDVLEAVHTGDGDWHGLHRGQVWSLWTRYACTAFYSHPAAWDEIGFAGPAFPRGYKNLGVDRREPFEVADSRPEQMPKDGTGR